MIYEVKWIDMPENVRENIFKAILLDEIGIISKLKLELMKYNGMYSDKGTIVFASDAHYNWFILRWS